MHITSSIMISIGQVNKYQGHWIKVKGHIKVKVNDDLHLLQISTVAYTPLQVGGYRSFD